MVHTEWKIEGIIYANKHHFYKLRRYTNNKVDGKMTITDKELNEILSGYTTADEIMKKKEEMLNHKGGNENGETKVENN